MPELKTLTGQVVETADVMAQRAETNSAFDQVMNGDPAADEAAAPPRRQRKPAEEDQKPPRRARRQPKEEQPRTAPKAASKALSDAERAAGVKGLAQIGAGLCLVASRATKSDALRADAITIASNADQIADACVQTAKHDANFAAALDKVCSAGPYAALITVAVGVGTQIVRNHRPKLALPNTVDPAQLLQMADQAERQQESMPEAA